MTKILYITNQICGAGGLERVLSVKASHLAEYYGYEVHIITLNQGDEELFYEFSPKLIYHDITVQGNPLAYFYTYVKGLRTLVKSIQPDMISVCDDGLKGLFVPLYFSKKCPIIYERHVSKNIEITQDNPSSLGKLKASITFKLMDIGGSMYDAFIVLTNGNVKEWNLKNVAVIPNPLSFYPEDSSTLTEKRVLAVGKQSFQKGYDRLLKSWKIVSEKHPDWVLDIYGKIDKSQGLDDQAKELQISDTVNLFPPVKNIQDKYKESSVYVMSSRFEGFGMVLTEAMSYGVPCVSFDCPYGPSDIITEGEDGFLVTDEDIEGLALKMLYLIENESERKVMGAKAKVKATVYLEENIAKLWVDLFSKLRDKNNV